MKIHKSNKLLFIPVYNCQYQIVRVLDKLESVPKKYFDKIIIVNNRSTDSTEIVALNRVKVGYPHCVSILRNEDNYGLGGSHKVAINYAIRNEYEHLIVLHGDDQGDLNELLPLLDQGLEFKYSALLNSRFMRGSNRIGYSKFRTFGNVVFNALFSLATMRVQYDLGSGLCCYQREFFSHKLIESCTDDLTFNYMLQLLSANYGFSQNFFPSTWIEDDQISNVKLLSQTVKMSKMLIEYIFDRKSFILKRPKPISDYRAQIIFDGESSD